MNMSQQSFQVIINDTSPNSIGRALLERMNPGGSNNFTIESEIGQLQISIGGWRMPRGQDTTRVYFVMICEEGSPPEGGDLSKFFGSLEAMSPTFRHGDKLIFAAQSSGQHSVDRSYWPEFNYTRVETDLRNIQVQRFLDLVTDVVRDDPRPIFAS